MAQLVASMSGVVLGGVAIVVGSNLTRGKKNTATFGSVDSLLKTSIRGDKTVFIQNRIEHENSKTYLKRPS